MYVLFVWNICTEYFCRIFVWNIFAEYFYGLFMTTIFYRHPIINGLIACNICLEYLFRIFMPNIYAEYFHVKNFPPHLTIYHVHVMKLFGEYFKYTHLMKSFSLLSMSSYYFVMLILLIELDVYGSKTHNQ